MEKLPVDLQYLDEDIAREADEDIRLMLVETLMLLCNRKADRKFVRGESFVLLLESLTRTFQMPRPTLYYESYTR